MSWLFASVIVYAGSLLFFSNLTQGSVGWEEANLVKKIPLSEWPEGKSMEHFLVRCLSWDGQPSMCGTAPALVILGGLRK